jgi:hypothetical protein
MRLGPHIVQTEWWCSVGLLIAGNSVNGNCVRAQTLGESPSCNVERNRFKTRGVRLLSIIKYGVLTLNSSLGVVHITSP